MCVYEYGKTSSTSCARKSSSRAGNSTFPRKSQSRQIIPRNRELNRRGCASLASLRKGNRDGPEFPPENRDNSSTTERRTRGNYCRLQSIFQLPWTRRRAPSEKISARRAKIIIRRARLQARAHAYVNPEKYPALSPVHPPTLSERTKINK